MPKKRKGERPDGLIQVSCSIGYDAEGKLLRKYFYGHTRAEAERKRDEYKRSLNPSIDPNITVSEWVDEYLQTYCVRVNPLYANAKATYYKQLKKAIGTRQLRNIRDIDLQRCLNELAGMSSSHIEKYRQVIRSVFRKAYKNNLIKYDPSDDLTMPQCTKGSHVALSKDIIKSITEHWHKEVSGLWVLIMLFCGLRRGEMLALQWDCINLTERLLTVKRTAVFSQNKTVIEERAKSSAGIRTIPIPTVLHNALINIPTERQHGFVCCLDPSEPLTQYGLSSHINSFCKLINHTFRLHDLRHTYCTLLYESGCDVKTAAYLMGHSDVKITMAIYTHLSEQQKAQSTSNLVTFIDNL